MLEWTDIASAGMHTAAKNLIATEAARRPANPALQRAWGLALSQCGEVSEAVDVLRGASWKYPNDQALKVSLAEALAKLGEIDAALDLARQAHGQDWSPEFMLRQLVRSGRFDETAPFEEKVAHDDPWHPAVVECRMQRLHDRPEERIRYSNALLAAKPGNARALHEKIIGLVQTGRDEMASALMDIGALLHREHLPPPPGFADRGRFASALAAEILAESNLVSDPIGHATRKGLRTRAFPRAGAPASEALVGAIQTAVTSYARRSAADHPFVQGRPTRARLNIWALIFHARARQSLHCHPDQWVTGVFYVEVPQTSGDGGAIRLGELPAWAGVSAPWPVVTIKPDPGTLLIFPSFVPHRTLPTDVEAPRISVAFDVA